MRYSDIITMEPGKRGGKPCIRGLRVTVYDVLEYLASGMSHPTFYGNCRSSRKRIFAPASRTPPVASASWKFPTRETYV